MALLTDVHSIQEDFSNLIRRAKAQALAQFIVWLDMKVAEYKVNGCMCLDQHVALKPQWLQGTVEDDESVKNYHLHSHKQKSSFKIASDSEIELNKASTGGFLNLSKNSSCKRKTSCQKSDDVPVSNSDIQDRNPLKKQCQSAVKKEVIDIDNDVFFKSRTVDDENKHCSDKHSQNTRNQMSFESNTLSNRKHVSETSSHLFSDSQSTISSSSQSHPHPFTKRCAPILQKNPNQQTASFPEQYKNQTVNFPGSHHPPKRTNLPSCTVTSKTGLLPGSLNERQLPSSSQSDTGDSASSADNSRIDQSDMPLVMKVESPDVEEEEEDLQIHESPGHSMGDSNTFKAKFVSHNSNIGKTSNLGGDELAHMSGFGREDLAFQDSHVPFPKLPGYRQTYTSDAHIAININAGKPYIFAKNDTDEQETVWQTCGMTGNTLFDKISTKYGRQYLKCPYCQYVTKRTFNFRRHLLNHGVVFYQRQLTMDDCSGYDYNSLFPEPQFMGTINS